MIKAAYCIFMFIPVFSPLAFGTVEPWSLTVMEGLTLSAVLLFFIGNAKNKEPFLYDVPGLIPLLCIWAYFLLQLTPLPSAAVKLISPATYALYEETIGTIGPVQWISLTVNKKATLMEFYRFTAYVLFYILTVQILTKKELLKKSVALIITFITLLSFQGILQYLLFNNRIYWIRELTQGGTPFGPYVNRNHYAGLAGMIFPLVLGLFIAFKPRVTYRPFRERISQIFNQFRTNIYILLGFSAVLISTSLFLSLSRGGIMSLSLSMIFFGALLIKREKNRSRGIFVIIIFFLIILSVGWFGWEPIIERFEKIVDIGGDIREQRLVIWKDGAGIVKDFPLTGTGFGSFMDSYPKYRTLPGDRTVDHAHNDYLELLADGGLISFILFGWFLLTLFITTYKTYLKRNETYSRYLYIGSVTGIVSILIHSLTDFNLHIGANGLYFSLLAGLAVSAANTRLRERLDNTYLKKIQRPLIRRACIPMAVVLLSFPVFSISDLSGRYFLASIEDINPGARVTREELLGIKETLYKASLADPLEARNRYALANAELILRDRENALGHYIKAVKLNPLNGGYLQRLGLILSEGGDRESADKLLRAGIKYDINTPDRYETYASYLFSLGDKERGILNIKKATSLAPNRTRGYITFMVLNGLSDAEIKSALPERVEPHLLFGDYLYGTDKEEAAEEAYLTALVHIGNEQDIKPSYFYKVYQYYIKKGDDEKALHVMRAASEYFPDNAWIRIASGGLYERLGITYRAVEEYQRALTIDPRNKTARKRLDGLTSTYGDRAR